MKLTEEILKRLIREAISIGELRFGELPPEVDKLSDFILSIPDDPKSNTSILYVHLADQGQLHQAKELAEALLKNYSDLLEQLKFNMRGKIMRKYGPGISSTRSREYRNMVQFFELFGM
tara:strand:+ start:1144 stop:1500 length:357 start_codon:yes stop_codon:yes gene_type:complete